VFSELAAMACGLAGVFWEEGAGEWVAGTHLSATSTPSDEREKALPGTENNK
jgi:hypothetical protein